MSSKPKNCAPGTRERDLDPVMVARIRAAKERPYFASGFYSLTLVPTEKIDTMGCDQYWRVYYNPHTVGLWTVEETAGVLVHELGHLIRDHHQRSLEMDADEDLANKAQDCELNDDILGEGLSLPRKVAEIDPETGAVTEKEFTPCTPTGYGLPDGRLWEEYYELLLKKMKEASPGGGNGKGKGGKGKGKKGGGDSTLTAPGTVGSGRCGSAAAGRKRDYELPAPSSRSVDVPGMTPAAAELLRRHVAQQILEHSRTRGSVPAGWKRWAEEKLQPQINWMRELPALIRRAVSEASGQLDYSYRQRSRRQSAFPEIIIPALRRPVPDVAVIADTSGSMSIKMIAQVIAEVGGVLASLGLHKAVTVLSVDAAVHACQQVFRPEQITLLGGGGTDMRVGFDHALKLKPTPQVIICLTDGCTPWPETPPRGTKVVVGLIGEGETPPWARTVKIRVPEE